MWESLPAPPRPPLPPIHTLFLLSIEIPWFDDGHTYLLSSGGPPHAFTRFPAGSNSSTGGAGTQHSLSGGFCAAPISLVASKVSLRCTMNTWSFASTPTPMTLPSTQWLGSGLGQRGSTSKRGAWTNLARADAS